MKEKAGSGRPIHSNGLQALQREVFSLVEKYISLNSDLRYENSLNWRDWSSLEDIGTLSVVKNQTLRKVAEHWRVSSQCLNSWSRINDLHDKRGMVCICGHPEVSHSGGGLCDAGSLVCLCRRPRPVIWVDDIRYFYRVTKGPHEAHALVLGLTELMLEGGVAHHQIDWQCEHRGCTGKLGVNPARFRNAKDLALGMPVQELNKLICEPCLFRELNGGYIYA